MSNNAVRLEGFPFISVRAPAIPWERVCDNLPEPLADVLVAHRGVDGYMTADVAHRKPDGRWCFSYACDPEIPVAPIRWSPLPDVSEVV